MPLRTDPLKELLELQERMNRLFEASLSRDRLDEAGMAPSGWVPSADVYETAEAFLIEVELPGIDKDDIEIQVQGDELTVRGQRQMRGARPECFHRMERRYGPFSRTFSLREDVDGDRVTAEFKEGLLHLEVPKVRAQGAWRVRVERAE
ncbi:MAG: Hsp20/alpha crystallin family protein [Solirubrobacterales bacterium]|jgi:HSP20 family protein